MARALAVRNVRDLLGIPNPDAVPAKDELPPGHLRLFNNWRPSLPAGRFFIEATQTVSGKGYDPVKIENEPVAPETSSPGKQEFNVVAPQFNLDPSLINSYYPPDGHQDEGRVLPHIVFSDPHVPWFREAGNTSWMTELTDSGRNFVPWLALMVFKAEDLRVSPQEAIDLKLSDISSSATQKVYDPEKLPASGAFGMTVGDYLNTITSRVAYDVSPTIDQKDTTSIIFPSVDQVMAVFNPTKDSTLKGLQAQKHLAHVRQLNTLGCPDAGVSGHGFYSVVVSSMTGDLTTISPTTHIVHLVSIESLDTTLSANKATGRIGLVSLFSWSYQCIPEAINFEVLMKNLGAQAQPLRPPKEQMDLLSAQGQGDTPAAKAAVKLHSRLDSGYTIARWRAPSGEESIAFNRGPLVPKQPPDVPDGKTLEWPALSMTGKDYLIFDKTLGIVDATYASAWSLGKLLAISDPAFNAALLRFRSAVWNASASKVRMDRNNIPSSRNVISSVVESVKHATALAGGDFTGPVNRLNQPSDVALAPPVDDPTMSQDFTKQIDSTTKSLAQTKDNTLYNGFLLHSAASSDWEIIYNWIFDVMFLGHLPAYALFPEPTHLKSSINTPVLMGTTKLQPEALRFFYIDHAWIDCFLDGALSCANHLEPEYDKVRIRIKQIFNDVLSQKIASGDKKLDQLPPVPRYGFIIRSAAVKATPDLKLMVRCWQATPDPDHAGKFIWGTNETRDPLIRHTKLDDSTILSLVDCLPEEISYIEFAQPAHQQRFAFGAAVTNDPTSGLVTAIQPKVDIIKLFTNANLAPPFEETGKKMKTVDLEWKSLPTQFEDSEQTAFYNSKSRCIDALPLCEAITDKVVKWGVANGRFDESPDNTGPHGVACSSIFGLEMNDRAYHFRILGSDPDPTKGPFPTWVRSIWAGPADAAPPQNTPPTEKTSSPSLIKTSSPTTVPSIFPSALNLTAGRAVFLTSTPVPAVDSRTTVTTAAASFPIKPNPYTPSSAPEFELLVHPDYRPPPPRPDTLSDTYIFSIADNLPTRTQRLYDLVFSLRRRHNADVHRTLRFLHIEIPVSRGSLAKDQESLDNHGSRAREPLISSGEEAHGGVSMAANPRFVPALFRGPASRINDGRWDSQDVLLITLTPRSGQADGAMDLLADSKSTAPIAVRLTEAVLADVVTPQTLNVYRRGPGGTGVVKDKVKDRAWVPIRLTEVYGKGVSQQWSWCKAVKASIGDPLIDSA